MPKASSEMQKQREQAFRENLATQKVVPVDLKNEMRKSFLDYSMSVIVERALPDVRDGLKPVHRRILYTMHENGLTPDKAYRKCADTVGSVLGRYHPHGDASVYDAMVRLAQDFAMRYTLVDGHGNFGSIDGDPPAAYRYTESRMSKISQRMLIAVGMATNIPPHNMREVVDGMCAVIDDPDIELPELMEHIPGPDFPTGAMIMGRSGIRAAYATGRGKLTVRAKTEIVEKKNGRFEIKVTEIPYNVNKARLVESIADLVKEKRVEGIADINDYSSMHGMYISVDLKRDANPQVVLNQLFQYTQLQTTFGVINLAIVDGEPKTLTLKEMLQEYIKFQESVIRRRTEFDLKKARDRAHILEGLARAIDIVDEIIATIRACRGGQAEAKQAIMDKFGFDDPQASAIVAYRLGQLAGLEILKIQNELEELHNKIADFEDILAHEERILQIIKDETRAIADKFGDDRRTEILNVSGEVDIEDLIPVEDNIITLTHMGYIKRMLASEYRVQRRGGRGISGMSQKDEDFTETIFACSSHDYIAFFTNFGRTFRLKAYEIQESSRTSRGMAIVNLLQLQPDEKVTGMIRLETNEDGTVNEDGFLCMVTKNGVIKRSALAD